MAHPVVHRVRKGFIAQKSLSRFPTCHDLSVYLSPSQTFTDSAHFSSSILSTPPNLCQVQPSLSLKNHNTKIVACSLLQEPKNLVKLYWPSNWHTTLSHRLSVSWSSRSFSALFSHVQDPVWGCHWMCLLQQWIVLFAFTQLSHTYTHACMHSRMYPRTYARTHACSHTLPL